MPLVSHELGTALRERGVAVLLLTAEKDPMVRVELILSLEGIEDAGVASVLLPILEDEDPALAAAALRVIIQLKEAPSRAPLLTVLE